MPSPRKPSRRPGASRGDPVERALRRAIRLLAASDKTRAELTTRLTRAGLDAASIAKALDTLEAQRLLSDARVARTIAQDDRVSRAFNRDRLEQRGLDPQAADVGSRDGTRAIAAAREIAAKLPASLAPATKWRRMLSALARRGFEEGVAFEAAQHLLGPAPEPPD